jgi:hypothetical protein
MIGNEDSDGSGSRLLPIGKRRSGHQRNYKKTVRETTGKAKEGGSSVHWGYQLMVDVDPQGRTLPAKRFLFHAFFDGDVGECPTIVASMASDTPCFNPFFLHIRLAALRTHKYSLNVVNFSNFFHIRLLTEDLTGFLRIARRLNACPMDYDKP